MGDVYGNEKPEDKDAVGAKVAELVAQGHELYATALTGSSSGRVRRPTLFAVSGAAIVVEMGTQSWIAGVIAILALLLLALTDAVVEL